MDFENSLFIVNVYARTLMYCIFNIQLFILGIVHLIYHTFPPIAILISSLAPLLMSNTTFNLSAMLSIFIGFFIIKDLCAENALYKIEVRWNHSTSSIKHCSNCINQIWFKLKFWPVIIVYIINYNSTNRIRVCLAYTSYVKKSLTPGHKFIIMVNELIQHILYQFLMQ